MWPVSTKNFGVTPLSGESKISNMQLAKQMMRDGARNIQEVATKVGYDSEAAFNRAFKRATGSPPAAWRKGAVGAI
jgi:AraC-like DNA-binding protein